MRICEHNGRIVEMQTHATAGTLLANAVAAGLAGATEREVTQAEYDALMYAQRDCAAEKNAVLAKFRYSRDVLLSRMTGVRVNDISPSDTAAINALTALRTALKDLPSAASVVNASDKVSTQTAITNEWNSMKATFVSALPTQESLFSGISPI
jgi:hypothetical protein